MAWSESSNTPHCAGRFYEDCESASENFLYRGRPQLPEESAAKTRILPKYTIFTRRSAESPPPLTDFGVDVSKAFGSGRSQSSTAVCRKDNAGGRDRGKILWTIEPSKRNGNNEFTLSGARWVALAWVSRVANGETVTRSMLNDLLSDALRAKNSVEGLSKAAIKNFPGLQLAEDISSFETVDHSMAIDSVVDALSDRSAPNMVSFAVLVKKNTCCHAVYLNNRGDTRDIVMLEVGVAGKHGNAKYTRIAAFRRLEHMREYLMDLSALKSCSAIHCYTFDVKSLQPATSRCTVKRLQGAGAEPRADERGNIVAESNDPRKDAKIVFSHAKCIAKM